MSRHGARVIAIAVLFALCAQFAPAAPARAAHTFATLTLVKEVSDAAHLPEEWSFTVSPDIGGQSVFTIPSGSDRVVIEDLTTGDYVITENGPAGYGLVAGVGTENCVFNGDEATASVAEGDFSATDATCVFKNTPQQATALRINNVIINDNGGTATQADFRLFVFDAPGGVVDVLSSVEVSHNSFNVFAPGTYWIAHQGSNGYYIFSFSGDCNAGGFVTLDEGDQLTCILTNDDQQGGVLVNVIADGGPLTPNEFDLFVGAEPVQNGVTEYFDSGTTTVSVSPVAGYVTSFSGNCDASGDIFVASGWTRTCVVTNTFTDPSAGTGTITVTKEVIGGTLQVADFPLFVGTTQVTSDVPETMNAGVYTIHETNQPGYDATFSGDCDASGQISLGAGQDLTCVITNTGPIVPTGEAAVTLDVIGGTVQIGDFDLRVGPTSVVSGATNTFATGTYPVTANGPAGYTTSYAGACATGNLTVTNGGSHACTVTKTAIPDEDDPAGTLTVVNVVVNNDGGTLQAGDFDLFVNAMSVVSGQVLLLPPGAYTVSETTTPGYVSAFSGDCDATGTVDLADGDDKVCTITNDDVAVPEPPTGPAPMQGYLTVVTNVVNDDGGLKQPADFLMTVDAAPASTFSGQATPGMQMAIFPGAYAVSGTSAAGYAMSMTPACVGVLLVNQAALCVVTYNDIATTPTGGNTSPLPPAPPSPPTPTSTPPAPTATDSATAPIADPGPVPQVLGATDEQLPVTGLPAAALVALAIAAFAARPRFR